MTANLAGIDPHQDSFTVGVIDGNGVEIHVEAFTNAGCGYAAAIELMRAHGVDQVGVEGSASWGSHIAVAVSVAGFDAREVPPQRSAAQRRGRRLDKTDHVDAVATARALLAEPSLGPVQALEAFDPLVSKIEAVLDHRRCLVETRQLQLHFANDQIAKLPPEIRDQLSAKTRIEPRLHELDAITASSKITAAGDYRLGWLIELARSDRAALAEIRRLERELDTLLDEHGTTLRDEVGIATIGAATLLCEVGNPFRFATESKFARWSGTGAIAVSSGEGTGAPIRHRLDWGGNRTINAVLYRMSVTQHRCHEPAATYINRKRSEGKTRREARRAHKRLLANRVIRRMWSDEQQRQSEPKIEILRAAA